MSRRERKPAPEESGGGSWLTTYSDLVTLLMCFFVLLFSFSEPDAEKFRMLSESFKFAFEGGTGVLDGTTSVQDLPMSDIEELVLEDEDLRNLYAQLKNYSEEQDIGDEISVVVEERGIIVRFKDNVLFDSGSAEIRPEAIEILNSAIEILNQKEFQDKQIKVEGHTDSDPIRYSIEYPTNWELSSARATNVLRYMIEEKNLNPLRISSSGYSQYRPIVPNDNAENKARNRRVDIVILAESYTEFEPDSEME